MFPPSHASRWWVSGQDNILMQWHPSFDAKYSGPNSFRTVAEDATSNIGTLFTGLQLTSTTEIFMHFEMADGGGIRGALGTSGFTALALQPKPPLGPNSYLSPASHPHFIPVTHTICQHQP